MKVKMKISYILFFLGLAVLVVSVFDVFRTTIRYDKNCTATTTGTVTYISYGGRYSLRKVTVVFQLEGKEYVAYSGGLRGVTKGQKAEVHYNPDKPSECYAGQLSYEKARAEIYILIFIAMIFVAVFVKIKMKRTSDILPDVGTGNPPDGVKITFSGTRGVKVERSDEDDEDRLV